MIVDVVIVTFNSDAVIGAALEGLGNDLNVIIVDNASNNDIAPLLAKHSVTLIKNARNLGFGTACNIGAKVGKARFILFLNPDTKADGDSIKRFVSTAQTYKNAAAFNPQIVDEKGSVTRLTKSPLAGKYHEEELPSGDALVPFLSGSALLVRRDIFEQVGGFDERIFLYYEDDDLSARIAATGHDLMLLKRIQLMHRGGASSGSSLKTEEIKQFWKIQSQRYIFKKHGLSFNTPRKLLSSMIRMIGPLLSGNKKKIAVYKGRIRGLLSRQQS